jgi:hypothetical protein
VKASAALRVATMVTVVVPAAAIWPSWHVTCPPPVPHAPCVGVAETSVTCVGRTSLTTTSVAPAGPALDTASVQVISSPTCTVAADAVLVIERSAAGGSVVVVVGIGTSVVVVVVGAGPATSVRDAVSLSGLGSSGAERTAVFTIVPERPTMTDSARVCDSFGPIEPTAHWAVAGS